jgi:tRNA(fMet)-specific endonuclease VapC
MIHLDSNVVIAVMNQRPVSVRERLDAALLAGTPMSISSVVLHELLYGAAISARPAMHRGKIDLFLATSDAAIAPFDDEDATHAADIRAALKRLGQPIGQYDLLIAASARRHGATLVTANRREFDRVAGLSVIDWAQ